MRLRRAAGIALGSRRASRIQQQRAASWSVPAAAISFADGRSRSPVSSAPGESDNGIPALLAPHCGSRAGRFRAQLVALRTSSRNCVSASALFPASSDAPPPTASSSEQERAVAVGARPVTLDSGLASEAAGPLGVRGAGTRRFLAREEGALPYESTLMRELPPPACLHPAQPSVPPSAGAQRIGRLWSLYAVGVQAP